MTSAKTSAFAAVPEPARPRLRPAPSGASIGIVGGVPGTLGCLVRDDTDGSVQILTTAGVVTRGGTQSSGTVVYQPAPPQGSLGTAGDAIGTVTRAIALETYPALYPPRRNASAVVDAAIIRPSDPASVSEATIDLQVPRASRLHPMVAVIVGTEIDPSGQSTYLALAISAVMNALSVSPIRLDSVAEPAADMQVTVVGATGVKAAHIYQTGVNRATVHYAHPDGPAAGLVSGAVRMTANDVTDDDIGAVAFIWRGNQVGSRCVGCNIAADLERTYDIPFTQDVGLADQIRDDYLLPTTAGAMLVQLFYKNEDAFRARLAAVSPTQAELDYARLLYTRYLHIVRDEIDDVAYSRIPVTDEVLDDVRASIYGLSRFMTAEEYEACLLLFAILEELEGQTVQQGTNFMNKSDTVDRVHDIISAVPGWDTTYDPNYSG